MRSWVSQQLMRYVAVLNIFARVKESDTGLASPNLWDLAADRQRMGKEHPLQVAHCTKIIPVGPKLAKAVNAQGAYQVWSAIFDLISLRNSAPTGAEL